MARTSKEPEYVEGSEAWKRFDKGMRTVLSVSREELQRRLDAEKARAAGGPKRGPKPGVLNHVPRKKKRSV